MIGGMLVVCAWCKRDVGTTGDPNDARTTHGICDVCASHLEASTSGVPLERFLDSLGVPVTLVDGAVHVVYANAAAQSLLKKPQVAADRRPVGRVFECEDSYQPGGCGRAKNCSSCVLWNAVTRCSESGQPEDGLVATLKQRTDSGSADLVMRISTRRVDSQVLLRIDEVTQ